MYNIKGEAKTSKTGKKMKRMTAVFCVLLCLTFLLPAGPAEAKAKTHLNVKKITMYVGESGGLVLLKNKKSVSGKCKWKVGNPKIIKLGENGSSLIFIDAMKKGKTTITCTKGKKKYKCKVTVKSLLKKSDVKVLASYRNADKQKVQLIRVKNSTKKKRNISLYQKNGDVMHKWYAIPRGKYAYFIRNTSFVNTIGVGRTNATIGTLTDTNPSKNLTVKVKAGIKVGENNRYTLTYKNNYKYGVTVQAVYVIYDKNKNPIYMSTENVYVPGKETVSNSWDCPGEKKAVSGKVYINATGY